MDEMEGAMTEIDMLDFTVYLQYKISKLYHDELRYEEISMGKPRTKTDVADSIRHAIPSLVLEYQDVGMGWKDPEKTEPED